MNESDPGIMVPPVKSMQVRIVHGYRDGLVQPSVEARFSLPAVEDARCLAQQLRSVLAPHVPPERADVRPAQAVADPWTQLAYEVSIAVAGLQEAAGIPVAGTARLAWLADAAQGRLLQLVAPSFVPQAGALALRWVLELLNVLVLAPDQATLPAAQIRSLQSLVNALTPMSLPGSNNIRFIRAAYEAGIPVLRLPGNVFQFGWGRRGRLFRSSITDETPAIAVTQCKDKLVTNATLRMAGLPVPPGQLAANEAAAVAVAARLGFPVVVKPADLDQGVGVAANLRTVEEVRQAFVAAANRSQKVMVERHVPGTAFRVTVFRGRSEVVVQRLPAGVTGDGTHTVAALVAEVNKDPRRAANRFSIMKPIVIDAEAKDLLAESGMSEASVPAAGQFVALKRAANLSTGGDAIVLDASEVHPSYRAMAERASKVLRLDVSGVDLVTADIRRPAEEAGAAIIEVNAQPQMGSILTHIHRQLLQQYVQGDGTIPTALVLGAGKEELTRSVREGCVASGARIGTIAAAGIFIGGDRIANRPGSDLTAVNTLLVDSETCALLLATDGENFHRHGLPLPVLDSLLLTPWPGNPQVLAGKLAVLKPHLRGDVVIEHDNPHRGLAEEIFGEDRVRPVTSRQAMTQLANRLLTVCQTVSGEA